MTNAFESNCKEFDVLDGLDFTWLLILSMKLSLIYYSQQ